MQLDPVTPLLPEAVHHEQPIVDTQADAVIESYKAEGMRLVERGAGEWCVLVMEAAT